MQRLVKYSAEFRQNDLNKLLERNDKLKGQLERRKELDLNKCKQKHL